MKFGDVAERMDENRQPTVFDLVRATSRDLSLDGARGQDGSRLDRRSRPNVEDVVGSRGCRRVRGCGGLLKAAAGLSPGRSEMFTMGMAWLRLPKPLAGAACGALPKGAFRNAHAGGLDQPCEAVGDLPHSAGREAPTAATELAFTCPEYP
jgi:hypothetical protein